MKFLVLSFLLLAVLAQGHLRGHQFLQNEENGVPKDIADIVVGFMEGLGAEGVDLDDFLKCMHQIPDVVDKVKEAVDYFKKIDFKHWEEIMKGIELLVDTAKYIVQAIDPCVSSSSELKAILEYILQIDPQEMAAIIGKNIIFHGGEIFKLFEEAVEKFKAHEYKEFGYGLGVALKKLITEQIANNNNQNGIPEDVYNFLFGFFEGISKGTIDVHVIIDCLKGMPHIVEDVNLIIHEIGAAIEFIKHFDIWHLGELVEAIVKVFEGVQDIIATINPCISTIPELKEIFDRIVEMDLKQMATVIAKNIIFHGAEIKQLITDAIDAYNAHDMHKFGKAIGEFIITVLGENLENNDNGIPEDVYNFLIGFFEGISQGTIDVHIIIDCLQGMPHIVEDVNLIIHEIGTAIEFIKHFDIWHLGELVEAIVKVFEGVQDILDTINPCISTVPELKEIFDRIAEMDLKHMATVIAKNVIFHGAEIKELIADAIDAYNTHDMERFGKDIGEFIITVLSENFNNENGIPEDVYNFLFGFFEGISKGTIDVQVIIDCLKGMPHIVDDVNLIIHEIGAAIEFIKHFDIWHLGELVEAIVKIFEGVQDIIATINPCLSTIPELKEIFDRIVEMDLKHMATVIAKNIIFHGAEIKQLVTDAIDAYNAHDMHKFGKSIGEFIITVLGENLESNDTKGDIIDLVIGLLEGFQVAGAHIDHIVDCINQIPDFIIKGQGLIDEVHTIIETIKAFDWKHIPKILKALENIFDIVKGILVDIEHCAEAGSDIKYIIDVFKAMTAQDFIDHVKENILLYGGRLITDVYDAFYAFQNDDYHKFGLKIADFLYLVVFGETVNGPVEHVYDVVKGLLEGLQLAGADIDLILKCFTDIEGFYNEFAAAMEKFAVLDFKHLEDIYEGIMMLYSTVMKILDEIKECKNIPAEFKDLIAHFTEMTWKEFANEVMMHILLKSGKLLDDIKLATEAWQNKEYQTFGRCIGDFIWTLL